MNLLGYLAIIALIVLGVWIVHDCIILYKTVKDSKTNKILEEEEDNDANRESGEDL